MNKNKILSKLNVKDYNIELEEILERKSFNEEAENLLLTLFYKIDSVYDDFKTVKRNVEDKPNFIENILKFISEDCDEIEIINPIEKSSKNKYEIVEPGKLKSFPDEATLLYIIVKNSLNTNEKSEDLKNESLLEMLKTGKSADYSEVVRDFSGWSWNNMLEDNKVIQQNLLFQNLILLLGYDNVNKLFELEEEQVTNELQILLKEKYSVDVIKNFLWNLYNVCIFIKCARDKKLKQELLKQKEINERIISKINDKGIFIDVITKEKIALTKKIKELDKIINNKELIELELKNSKIKNLNERKLKKKLENERKTYLKELKDYNQLIDPKKYLSKKEELEKNFELYSKLKIDSKNNINIDKTILGLQQNFMECFKEKINNCKNKANFINIIYELRYYRFLKYRKNKFVKDNIELKENLKELLDVMIKKGQELKVFEKYSTNQEVDKFILEEIFNSKILKIENIYFKIIDVDEKKYVQYYDGNIEDVKKEIILDEEELKLKKKNKIIV